MEIRALLAMSWAPYSPPNRCAVLVDRHVHKTGGTTLRNIFLNNECRDPWMYVGYGLERPDWRPLLQELASINNNSVVPSRLLVEVHYPAHLFHERRIQALAQQRERLRGSCTIVLMTRVRDPLSFYWSFFTWSLDRYHGLARQSNEALAASFWEWAPANLQSNILWNAEAAIPAENSAAASSAAGRKAAFDEQSHTYIKHFGRMARDRLFSVLELYDIIGVVEEWDASLLLAAHRVGLR